MRLRLEREAFDYQTLRVNLGWPEHSVRLHAMAGIIASSGATSLLRFPTMYDFQIWVCS